MNYCKCALWKEGLLEHGMVIVRVHMMVRNGRNYKWQVITLIKFVLLGEGEG